MQNAPEEIVVRIGGDPPARLDSALAKYAPDEAALTRTRAGKLIRSGAVSRGGEVVLAPSAPVRADEEWRIALPAEVPGGLDAEDIPLEIVFEDRDLLIVDKPAGMVVHPAKGNRSGTLVNALLHHCGGGLAAPSAGRYPGIVHRIDKDTSGLLAAAKSDIAMRSLSEQFAAKTVLRKYLAILKGVPGGRSDGFGRRDGVGYESGGVIRIESLIGRHPANRLKMSVVARGGRRAATRLRVVEPLADGEASLVECRLETGRTHQIRVHLEYVGHPVIGDPLYGGANKRFPGRTDAAKRRAAEEFPRQALHAGTLGVAHPRDGQRLEFESELPPDIQRLLDALKDE